MITFYVPMYAPAANQSLEFDDITVRGNVAPMSAPPYAGSSRLFLRVRSP